MSVRKPQKKIARGVVFQRFLRSCLPGRARFGIGWLLLVALGLTGCAAPDTRPFGERLPAQYTGVLPCDGCAATVWRLQLFPDHSFLLHRTAPETGGMSSGRAAAEAVLGRWLQSTDGHTLSLHGLDTEPVMLVVESAQRLLAPAGDAPPMLERDRQLGAPTAMLELRGMYRPPQAGEGAAAGPARFEECQTGLQLPLAAGAEAERMATLFAQLQQLSTPVGDPGRLLMTVEGELTAAADGPAVLRVTRLVRAWPDLKCPHRIDNAVLTDTYWRLVQVDNFELPEGERRAPFLRFEADGRLSGSTGCNRLGGTYTINGSQLTLGNLATTRMSCPGTAVLEQMVTGLLRNAVRWNLIGTTLELFDADGNRVGRLEARTDH